MKFPLYRIAAGCASAFLLVVVASCSFESEPDLPQGVQTMTGRLIPVSLSVTRLGTHALTQDGEPVYLVESSKADLRDYEGVDVVVTGLIERNTDPKALPVLVASGVVLVDQPTKMWQVEPLMLSLDVPEEWSMMEFDDGVQFSLTGSDLVQLKVHSSALTELPPGTITQVAGRKASRTTVSGTHVVYVQNGRLIIAISRPVDPEANQKIAEAEFNRILRSVKFVGQTTSSRATTSAGASQTSAATSTQGVPCGGPAGVLCPSGQYCEVTDHENGIGRCRSLKR